MRQLVIKDASIPFMKGTIDVGWRMQCSDGYHDAMWGNTKNDATLRNLIRDAVRRYGPITIIDERQNVVMKAELVEFDITPERGEPCT